MSAVGSDTQRKECRREADFCGQYYMLSSSQFLMQCNLYQYSGELFESLSISPWTYLSAAVQSISKMTSANDLQLKHVTFWLELVMVTEHGFLVVAGDSA